MFKHRADRSELFSLQVLAPDLPNLQTCGWCCDDPSWSRDSWLRVTVWLVTLEHGHGESQAATHRHAASLQSIFHQLSQRSSSEREIIKMLCSRGGGMEYIPAIIHSNFLLSPSPHSTPFICSLRCEMFLTDIFQIYCLHSEFSFLSINLDCSLLQRKINFKLEKVKFQSWKKKRKMSFCLSSWNFFWDIGTLVLTEQLSSCQPRWFDRQNPICQTARMKKYFIPHFFTCESAFLDNHKICRNIQKFRRKANDTKFGKMSKN